MSEDLQHLLTTRRFLPLFLTQALGALNDNLFKNALVVLVIFRLAGEAGLNGNVFVSLAAGLFILPFFLFSATAGQLADKVEKTLLIRTIKAAEIAIMGLGAAAFWLGDIYLLVFVLFLMGTHSAFFGPIKYSILPDLLRESELIAGNGLVEAGTFLAILIGTIAGGLLILGTHGIAIVSAGIVAVALAGFAASFGIPRVPAPSPALRINPNFLGETFRILAQSRQRRDLNLSILGISWFWLIGATYLTQFPAFTRDVIAGNETVVTLFLTAFSIGIGLGSLLCNRLLKGEVSAAYVPLGALGMTLFTADLSYSSQSGAAGVAGLIGAWEFLSRPESWRIVVDMMGTAICGGIYIVPLYAILQTRGDPSHRSRVIAANNIMNALFMVVGSVAVTVLLAAGVTIPGVFLVVAAVNGFVAFYICGLLPDALIKSVLVAVLKLLYRVEVRHLDAYARAGKRAVIVVNHVSFLDAVLLAAFLPRKPMFAIDSHIARAWWVRPFLHLVEAFPMDPTNPMATKSLIRAVQQDRHCVIFPEGRITVTGALMKVYEGPGMIADKADAMLVPIRIDGAQYTPFSRLRGKVRRRWFPKIVITVLEPRRFAIPDGLVGRARRRFASTRLYDVMTEMIFETCERRQTLFEALLDAKAIHGGRHVILEDAERKPVTYRRLVLGVLALGRRLAKDTVKGERIGVLLPNAIGTVVAFFALQAIGRVPAMLNYSAGARNMLAALTAADIKTVLTSRRFVEAARLEDVVMALSGQSRIAYLEDIRCRIGPLSRLMAVISLPFARAHHSRADVAPDEPAVVLFTSGSEGTPKGVVLSHANLLANRHQLAACIDFNPTDIVFNALPVFHSFGLTGGMLLPVLSGVKTFLYPSPLHYRVVPALVYDTNATILFGTDTFLSGYARVAHAYDFYSIRYVFAGAEKVKVETRRTWAEKFGLRILEGYGATETAPVLAANTPMHYKAGTVGRFMPGISYEIEHVEGIAGGGRLIVRGANVMLGYLHATCPGVLDATADGRYDTGDIVSIDDDGFLTILGRAKRFAKIGGEMVSLGAVETHAASVWPDHGHAVVCLPDDRTGERLVLVTEKPAADRQALLEKARQLGIPELMVPKDIRPVESLPLLGSGKVDYVSVMAMVGG